jgi:hypothetical protein
MPLQHGAEARKPGNSVCDNMNGHERSGFHLSIVIKAIVNASHRVRKRSSSVHILCARSSVISNLISASAVVTWTMPVSGSVDFVATRISVITCALIISNVPAGWRLLQTRFLGFVSFEELDADLIAGYADHPTAPKCEACGRQKQEEFLEVQSLEGTFDAQSRAGLRHIDHDAVATPGSINPHDVNMDAAFEIDTLAFSLSISHLPDPIDKSIRCPR